MGVWLRRNAWVFERKQINIEEVVSKASRIVFEYQECMGEMSIGGRDVAEKRPLGPNPNLGWSRLTQMRPFSRKEMLALGVLCGTKLVIL